MTQKLQTVFDKLQKLPPDEQNRYAAQLEEQLRSDAKWDQLFAQTTDAQWDKMIASVEAEIEAGHTEPLEDYLNDREI